MHKLKQLITSSITQSSLVSELNRLGREVFSVYEFTGDANNLAINTIQDALEADRKRIEAEDARRRMDNKPYVDLTTWELLQPDELLIVYNTETNAGRLLTAKELDEYIGSADGSSLTPAAIRRWYVNRKNEAEYLVSDYEVPTFWIPE